jgi:hypothetical protein
MPQTEVRVFRERDGSVPLTDWLDHLENRNVRAYAKCVALIQRLAAEGHALRRPTVDYLRDGIYELRTKDGRVNYRILFAYCEGRRNVAVLSHGLTKEREVDDGDIETAIRRMELVRKDFNRYTAEF